MKSRLLCPLLTSALRSARLTTRSAPISRQQRRSPGVSSTAFTARLPDIPPWPLMVMDFVVGSPLVRPQQPLIRFLFVRPQLRSTLPPDPASRRRPCASLPFTTIRLVEDFHLLTVEHAQHTTAPAVTAGKRKEDVSRIQHASNETLRTWLSAKCNTKNGPDWIVKIRAGCRKSSA